MTAWILAALLVSVALNIFLGIALILSRTMVRWTMDTNDFLTRQHAKLTDTLIEQRVNEMGDDDETA